MDLWKHGTQALSLGWRYPVGVLDSRAIDWTNGCVPLEFSIVLKQYDLAMSVNAVRQCSVRCERKLPEQLFRGDDSLDRRPGVLPQNEWSVPDARICGQSFHQRSTQSGVEHLPS